jgi:WD40 repeat protein
MQKLVNEEMVYFVANVVVLLNPNICKQRFYVQHEQEVISCAVSNIDAGLVATGELGKEPAVHIWNSHSLECLKILKGIHMVGVHLLAFSNDDTMVISCSLSNPSSVLIYRWQHKRYWCCQESKTISNQSWRQACLGKKKGKATCMRLWGAHRGTVSQ